MNRFRILAVVATLALAPGALALSPAPLAANADDCPACCTPSGGGCDMPCDMPCDRSCK